MSRFSRTALRCLTAGLLLLSIAMAVKGLRQAWYLDGDGDMQMRVAEYAAFRQGVYPTRPLETEIPEGLRVPYTVYPPYALAMFVAFFEPLGKLQGRVLIELLSLISLVGIGFYGYRLLRGAGTEAGLLGALAAAAISGNGNAIALGQFSILCAGALLMQIVMLEQGRPMTAGAWWALAMLKPQIGLTFAGLFLVRREWRGLACGLGILLALSLAACWWTEVSPLAVIDHWLNRINMRFAAEASLPGRLAATLGMHPRVLHLTTAAMLLVLVPILFSRRVVVATRIEPLVLAAVAALLGGVFLYHLFYDNVMMFPLLFVALEAAARRPTPWSIGVATATGLSLWMPQQVINRLPFEWLVRPVAWIACAAAILSILRRDGLTTGPTTLHHGQD